MQAKWNNTHTLACNGAQAATTTLKFLKKEETKMWHDADFDESDEAIFLAGERVSPGNYRLVGGSGRQLVLEEADVLPATFDGRVACYLRVENTWGQIAGEARA